MKLFIIGILFAISFNAFEQQNEAIKTILGAIISHAEEASLYRNDVDWKILKGEIYDMASDANSVAELKPALKYLLKSLGDGHGRIFHNNQILANHDSGTKAHHSTLQNDIYNNVQMGRVYKFHTEMLGKDIGYVRIVGLPMGDNQQMAKEIQDGVCNLIENGAKKWILDLRYNGGGNMHPMAEGIASIIRNGKVGGSKGLTDDESSIWKVENSDFYYDDYSVHLANDCKTSNNPKVAVLTSVYTASSGEAIAVIFKERENTKFFGEKTLGMITVTDWHVIDNSTAMTISVSYYKDRNGNVYDKYVDVDVEIPFVALPLSDEDEAVEEAKVWLEDEN